MYKIVYVDGTEFDGGNPDKSGWNDIANKQILSLTYSLFNKTYKFEGFEKYNHVIKVGLWQSGFNNIILVGVMGLYKEKVHQIIFNYMTKKISKHTVDFGKEYNNKALPDWKEGITPIHTPTIYEI